MSASSRRLMWGEPDYAKLACPRCGQTESFVEFAYRDTKQPFRVKAGTPDWEAYEATGDDTFPTLIVCGVCLPAGVGLDSITAWRPGFLPLKHSLQIQDYPKDQTGWKCPFCGHDYRWAQSHLVKRHSDLFRWNRMYGISDGAYFCLFNDGYTTKSESSMVNHQSLKHTMRCDS